MEEVLKAIGLVLGGGVIGQFFNFFISKKSANRDDFSIIVEKWQSYADKIETEKQYYKDRLVAAEGKYDTYMIEQRLRDAEMLLTINNLREEVSDLRIKILLLESAHLDLPCPAWLKDLNGIMLSINKSYATSFLTIAEKAQEDYIGFKDEDVWGVEIAAEFRRTDLYVLSTGQTYYGKEPLRLNGLDLSGNPDLNGSGIDLGDDLN